MLLERRVRAPLIDPRLFAEPAVLAANAVSLLTGYTLATAIIGGPVFVNRVLNGGAGRIRRRAQRADRGDRRRAPSSAACVSAVTGERITATVLGVALTALGLWLALGWGTDTDLGAWCATSPSSAPGSA